jgi:hypothetical protein
VIEEGAVLISKIIQRVDQGVQIVLGLIAGGGGMPLGQSHGGADGVAAGEDELFVALANGGLLGCFTAMVGVLCWGKMIAFSGQTRLHAGQPLRQLSGCSTRIVSALSTP